MHWKTSRCLRAIRCAIILLGSALIIYGERVSEADLYTFFFEKPTYIQLGIDRVYMTIGGKGADDFERIADLMDMDDIYSNDVQRNIRAIYNGCPAIDGFNIDGRSLSEEDISEDLITALTNLCK